MRRRGLLAACVGLLAWASPADAQPLFRRERAWTVDLGGRTWGWCDVVQAPGDFWWPEVWVAGRPFMPTSRPADRWLLAAPPVAAVLAVRFGTRPLGRGRK